MKMEKHLYTLGEIFHLQLAKSGLLGGGISSEKIGIYGSGVSGKNVLDCLLKESLADHFVCFIDRDESPAVGHDYLGYPVVSLSDAVDAAGTDVILIASAEHHLTVKKRVSDFLSAHTADVAVVDMFGFGYSFDGAMEYLSYIEDLQCDDRKDFVKKNDTAYERHKSDTKLIAWYLPQYYVTDYNNRFHGMGFTEWTNSSKALPQFAGHYQPHIPYDVGYYDLTNHESIQRQAELARYYGIYGFCIHYYWFDEHTKMLETPLKVLFENKDIDINYCLNWATEDWCMEWDDSFENWDFQDSFIEQKLPQNSSGFIEELLPYFNDERYIKIDGRPLFSVYHCKTFDKTQFREKISEFRQIVKRAGFPDLYVAVTTGRDMFDDDCAEWGADAVIEYQPNMCRTQEELEPLFPYGYVNPHFKGSIVSAKSYLEEKKYLYKHKSKKFFRCACTAWDNTARKGKTGANILLGITPGKFKNWIKDLVTESREIHGDEENLVFLSSWNEWAEGSHLEPDLHFGYAWLDAVRRALEESRGVQIPQKKSL